MAAHTFLKKRGHRIWISLIILALLIALYFYFAVKEKDSTLNLLNKFFAPNVSEHLIIVVPIFAGLIIVPFLINFLTTDLGAKLDEKPDEKEKSPASLPVNITVKTETTQSENNQPKIPEPANQKFYPSTFIPDLKFFVGRKKLLKDLEKKLKAKQRASIHDISGLGKTFTTFKYAEEHRNEYEKIFFVRASKEEMMQSLAEIGVLLNPSLKEVPEQTKQASGFKKWLEENENWLVIYDNVDKPHELNPYVPQNKKGDCIFTSNFHSIETLAESVGIEKLDDKDAESLLFSRAVNKPHSKPRFSDAGEQKAFENIVRETDGHPLSLNTSGAFVSENRISLADYWRILQNTPNVLLENEDDFDNYQHKSALKAFSIAIDDICEKKANDKFINSADLAKKLLFALSYIAPDNIYEDFLQKTLIEISKPENFLQRIWQKITGTQLKLERTSDLWLEIRHKLLAYDLLKYDTNAKTFTTHRLIQKVIQTKQSDNEKSVICNIVLHTIDELFPHSEFGNWEECSKFLQHSITAAEFAERIKIKSETFANNYYKIAVYLNDIAQYQQAEDYLNKAILIYREIYGEENINVANCYNVLAIVYLSQGNYDEAIISRHKALELNKKLFGEEHSRYAIDLNNLANVYYSQRKYEEAIQLYKQSLEIAEKAIGKEHPDYATRLNNLASVYKSQGRYEEAIELYQQALEIGKKTIGKAHPDYAIRLNNLANVYYLQGKYEDAIELYKQALEITGKTNGKEHPAYAIRLNNLASVYQSQGRYEEALSLFEESLGIFENTLPKNHPNIQIVRKGLESCRRAAGKG